MARNHKHYTFIPRWKIEVELTTTSFLHIGCNEITHRDNLVVKQQSDSKVLADISAFIKDGNQKPYIPGSTVKGNIRQWLNSHLADNEAAGLANHLLGCPAAGEEQGCGGASEFHAGILTHELTDGSNFPYWDKETQTCVETSTVIDRTTGTVVEKKLFYTESVPPGVGFKLTITGAMTRQEVSLLAAALQTGFPENCQNPITFGADNGNGKGLLKLEGICLACLGEKEVRDWLAEGTGDMAANTMRNLAPDEVGQYVTEGQRYLVVPQQTPYHIDIDLQFAGPFLVNDPSRCQVQEIGEPNHKPLRDENGNPRLPATSIRGVLRSQAEKIIRTLGGHCCDPVDPCPAVYTVEEANNKLCLACRLFGASGWKSRISIEKIRFKGAEQASDGSLEHQQDFVAIDRFHGGSRDTAKFKASFSYRPSYSIHLALAHDCTEWQKGLLALTLRDLKESDITFGFGRAKGYGRIDMKQTTITGAEFLQSQSYLVSFRKKCEETRRDYPCESSPVPQIKESPPRQQDASRDIPSGQQFHNPYHFIPILEPDTQSWLPKDNFNPTMHDSHALYRDSSDQGTSPIYHGKISCTLTTQTPTFVGGLRNGGEPERIDHYVEGGEVAMPATTLRGLLSSLAEAASNSSMRVLDDTLLSYRQPVGKDNLSAIGMVIIRDDDYYLYPLALPTFDQKQGLPGEYRVMFPCNQKASLKVYLKNAYQAGAMKNFLDDKQSWSLRNPKIYYLPVPEFHFTPDFTVQGNDTNILKRRRTKNMDLIFGASLEGNPCPANTRENENYVPGILRILGKQGREGAVPTTKKHELFIPVPNDFANNPKKFIDSLLPENLFRIPSAVVANFKELADQRTKPQIKHPENISETQWLPYHLKGCTRNSGLIGNDMQKLRLQQGDLVFFRPFPGEPRQVAEISFSSMWRSRVNKTVHKFFPAELRPFSKDRMVISPAELLFGFVQQDTKKENDSKEKKLSFAGKVQVSSARVDRNQAQIFMDNEETIKILSNPKLPSPSLYFKGNGYVAKSGMDSGVVQPQGRKQYLHALVDKNDPQGVRKLNRNGLAGSAECYPWESRHKHDSLKQKVQITPLKKDISFSFSLEFENCTAWELGLLLYTLRPTKKYRHKIGMGKPIGLGTVRIDIDDLQFINRKQRYGTDILTDPKYNQTVAQSVEKLRTLFSNTIAPDIRNAIELLGDPDNVRFPVHYPQVKGHDLEKETFLWFVDNDNKERHDYLEPLTSASWQLPVLTKKDKL